MSFVLPGGLGQIFAGGLSAWSTTNNSGSLTFSNSNRSVIGQITTTNTGSGTAALPTGVAGSKKYFEVKSSAAVTSSFMTGVGIANQSWAPPVGGNYVGSDNNSVGPVVCMPGAIPPLAWNVLYLAASQGAFGATPAAGDVIGVAVDLTTSGQGNVYFSLNGTWLNNAGTGTPDYSLLSSTTIVPIYSDDNGTTLTLNVGNAAFAHAPPSGYTKWG